MRAVVLMLWGRLRQYWKSWLALSLLVAVAGGFVLAALVAAHRTATALPGFVAIAPWGQRRGVQPAAAAATGPAAGCRLGDAGDRALRGETGVPVLPQAHRCGEFPGQRRCHGQTSLPRLVSLLSGRMPDQSDPYEVLASFTLARDNGVRIGSVLRVPLGSEAQLNGETRDQRPVMEPALRVVGIAAAETEFASGTGTHYDLYATRAFAAAANRRAAPLYTYYVRFVHGPADLEGFDSRIRSLKAYGTYDVDESLGAVEDSIRPQVIGWYVLAGLAALAALAVIGQAVARQAATERADHPVLSALGVRPRQFVLLGLARSLLIGAAGAVGAVLLAVLASPLSPVGVARFAVPWPVGMSFDPVLLPLGALALLAGRGSRGLGLRKRCATCPARCAAARSQPPPRSPARQAGPLAGSACRSAPGSESGAH